MRTKQEIAAAARKLADQFSNLPAGVTAETTASAAYVFGLVGYVAQELAEMVRDLTEVDVAASDDVKDKTIELLSADLKRMAAECDELRDIASRSSRKPKWDIKKLDAIAVRIGLEVARVDDRIEVLHNGLTVFAGDPEPAAGFLIGWERCCIDRWRRTNKAGR